MRLRYIPLPSDIRPYQREETNTPFFSMQNYDIIFYNISFGKRNKKINFALDS